MQTSIDINASPQAAWDIVTDLDRMGEWVTIHGRPLQADPQGGGDALPGRMDGRDGRRAQAPELDRNRPGRQHRRTSYELTDHEGGTRFGYDNELSLPGGKVGEAAADVVSGAAEREADDSLGKLKVLAER